MNKSTILLISLVVVLILFSSEIQEVTGSFLRNPFSKIRVPLTSIKCSDSDGLNYNTAGTVTLKYLDKYGKEISRKTYTDNCYWTRDAGVTNTVVEYYCSNNQLASTNFNCPYKCENGACRSEPTCTDTDNGKNYNIKGNIYGLCKDCKPPVVGSNTDHCVDANNLREFYCTDFTGWVREVVNCPSGCKDGACIQEQALCKPLYPNHNQVSEDRFNFVFEGVGYQNMREFLEIIENFIDLNSVDYKPGLFGQEPFKSNKDLFNFWYVGEVNNCYEYDFSNGGACNNKAIQNYNLCNFTHKYYFRFFPKSLLPWTPYLGLPNQDDLWIWSFSPTSRSDWSPRELLLHEFGHWFSTKYLDLRYLPILLDEYSGIADYPNYTYINKKGPFAGKIFQNVFINESITSIEGCKQFASWKDLIGNGCGKDGIVDCALSNTPSISGDPCKFKSVDCYKEVSCFEGALNYNKGLFRPTYSSIMNRIQLEIGYNLPSQRHFCRIFEAEIKKYGGICNNLIVH